MQRNTLLVLAGAAVLIIVAALTLDISAIVHHLAHAAQQLRETHPLTAGFAAMLVFTAWSMLLPASPMELSISYIFGFWRGFTIVYFGKLCTCLLAYILSRSCLRSWAHEAFSKHEVLRAFESECVSRPWRVAFLLRAVYIPLPVKNYGGGALGLPPLPWSVATLIVEVPDTYFTAALGSAARSVTELLHGGGEHGSTSWTTVIIMGAQCVLLVGVLVWIAHIARRALDEKRAAGELR